MPKRKSQADSPHMQQLKASLAKREASAAQLEAQLKKVAAQYVHKDLADKILKLDAHILQHLLNRLPTLATNLLAAPSRSPAVMADSMSKWIAWAMNSITTANLEAECQSNS